LPSWATPVRDADPRRGYDIHSSGSGTSESIAWGIVSITALRAESRQLPTGIPSEGPTNGLKVRFPQASAGGTSGRRARFREFWDAGAMAGMVKVFGCRPSQVALYTSLDPRRRHPKTFTKAVTDGPIR
jgi:hypothetical protein